VTEISANGRHGVIALQRAVLVVAPGIGPAQTHQRLSVGNPAKSRTWE